MEHIQHAGHVHPAHEVDGKHNVEFDHEAILGVLLMQCCYKHTIFTEMQALAQFLHSS